MVPLLLVLLLPHFPPSRPRPHAPSNPPPPLPSTSTLTCCVAPQGESADAAWASLQACAARNPEPLGALLLEFFWYFGVTFDSRREVVSAKSTRRVLKDEKGSEGPWGTKPNLRCGAASADHPLSWHTYTGTRLRLRLRLRLRVSCPGVRSHPVAPLCPPPNLSFCSVEDPFECTYDVVHVLRAVTNRLVKLEMAVSFAQNHSTMCHRHTPSASPLPVHVVCCPVQLQDYALLLPPKHTPLTHPCFAPSQRAYLMLIRIVRNCGDDLERAHALVLSLVLRENVVAAAADADPAPES